MTALGKLIHLTVPKWHKWNPRKDLKSTSWFRLQNNIFEDPQFFDFDHSELLFFIYILSHASRKMSSEITVNVTHAVRIGKFQKETISSSLKKLEELQCVLRRDVDDTSANPAVTPHNEQNVTNPTNKTLQNEPSEGSDFKKSPHGDFPDTPEGRTAYIESLKSQKAKEVPACIQ